MNALSRHISLQRLISCLTALPALGQDYERREDVILQAMLMARRVGYRAGYRIDPKEPGWPVAFIELPTGQVSWHMPGFPVEWDGHDTDEKVRRIRLFLASQKRADAAEGGGLLEKQSPTASDS